VSFTIRPAEVSDADSISTLIISLAEFFISDPGSPEVSPFLDTLTPEATAERIASMDFEYFVAENDHHICGVIGIRDGSHVYHLFVQRASHHQGIARALWDHVRARSSRKSFTVNSSIFAVPIYERLGFSAKEPPRKQDGLEFVPMEYRDDSKT